MNLLCVSQSVDIIGFEMLHELTKQGINVFIATSSETERKNVKEGCLAIDIPAFHSKFKWSSIHAIRSIIRKYEIDVIYSHSSKGLSLALFASLGTKAKIVGYRGTQAKIRRLDPTYYLATLNPRVDHMICATTDIKEQLSRFIPANRLTVNPKPYNVEWVADACRHPKSVEGIPTDAFQIIYLGNAKGRPHKGLSILIKAIHLLNDPRVHLIFAGDYDEADHQLAQQGPAGERIHFLGERQDAIYFLPGKDVFVLPSTRDASPRCLREAMACSLPCIVSNIPGARDLVIDGHTALLVEPNSPVAIANAIRYFMEHEDKKIAFGKAGRQRIITDFVMDRYVETAKKVFYSVLK